MSLQKHLCQYSWKTSSLQEEFRYGELWYRVSSGVQTETRRILFLGSCVLMALGRSLLGQEFEEKWWSYPCSKVCRHSWETRFPLAVFVYVVLWHRISSGHRWRPEDSCSRQPLCSCVLRVPGGFSEQQWWSDLHSQACLHSWGAQSLLALFGYGALWQRICYRQRQNLEG